MYKFLDKSHILKQAGSILLLFVFCLGITPKKTLHDWLANHKDTTSSAPVSKTQQLSKGGFNCNCENLVAESHFVTFSNFVVVNFPSIFSFVSFRIPFLIFLPSFQNNLRGPPLEF
ncbi:hypothetical protein FW778_13610 [Ginsengibacter hankyongi]|uniref:Uncharacterized protein n=1 Tax=Ginsengibacter hankyongi TaxID=2607284 RepID=A0A5J5IFP6_9BACT|nr:hypothetical protein [Ginsengibacter hankyongi]KAA9038589.1 hypothetical protein FW778_13610 [Ginsengibacter hankyongi]